MSRIKSKKTKKAFRLDPQLARIFQQGNMAHQQNRLQLAEQAYLEVIRGAPDFPDVHFLLGALYMSQGALQSAEPMMFRAAELAPLKCDFWNGLGQVRFKLGRYGDALECFQRCEKLNPRDVKVLASLGACLLRLKRFEQAKNVLQRASRLNADSLEVMNNLGSALVGCMELDKALMVFEEAAKHFPESAAVRSNLLFNSNYSNTLSAQELFLRHRHYCEHQVPVDARVSLPELNPAQGSKVRIGVLSPDFRKHSVAYFFLSLLEHIDRSRFEIYCYYSHGVNDAMTQRIESLSDVWRVVAQMPDEVLRKRLLDDQLHVLFDLAGHTQHNRSRIFGLRAAPIQVNWLGYPHSSGLQAMDYRIVDSVTDPAPDADSLSTEKLVRLERCFICYQGDEALPESKDLPASKNQCWTFGSFNNLAKVNTEVVAAWSRILNGVPGSRMLIKAPQLGEQCVKNWLIQAFESHGVSADRLMLHATVPDFNQHMRLYDEVDIALDTFPYNGTTTTCEALWMGVPTVVFVGDRHASRVGASLLKAAGLSDFVANDVAEYVSLAQSLTERREYMQSIRTALRKKMISSELCDAAGFARSMENAIEQMIFEV